MTNIYLQLTQLFNAGRLRCILSSGQAVVLHGLAMMSKDGDWIVREDQEALDHVLQVLEKRGARYRLGAPLDVRWMAGGWSAHFEFIHQDAVTTLRVRTDFVTRPPRLTTTDLAALWQEQESNALKPGNETVPVIDLRRLAELKKTNRERDYAVIGELARRFQEPRDRLLFDRSARDLTELAAQFPALVSQLSEQRPVLAVIAQGRDALEAALDAERRILMRRNEERLARYVTQARQWYQAWPSIEREIAGLPLRAAHQIVQHQAAQFLPMQPDNAQETSC